MAVAASVLTNIVVFTPIAFMKGIIGQFFFQFPVYRESSADEPDAGGSGTVTVQGRFRGGDNLRMIRKSQIIVAAGQDHAPAVDNRLGG